MLTLLTDELLEEVARTEERRPSLPRRPHLRHRSPRPWWWDGWEWVVGAFVVATVVLCLGPWAVSAVVESIRHALGAGQ